MLAQILNLTMIYHMDPRLDVNEGLAHPVFPAAERQTGQSSDPSNSSLDLTKRHHHCLMVSGPSRQLCRSFCSVPLMQCSIVRWLGPHTSLSSTGRRLQICHVLRVYPLCMWMQKALRLLVSTDIDGAELKLKSVHTASRADVT